MNDEDNEPMDMTAEDLADTVDEGEAEYLGDGAYRRASRADSSEGQL